uniref:Uncharacterized protein n=1 Tax=Scophthalmus maximus TaxID=52904 RepID=A0A8D3ADF0_SCOMX
NIFSFFSTWEKEMLYCVSHYIYPTSIVISQIKFLRKAKKEEEEEVVQEQEDPNQVVLQTTHTKTLMVYKKDFVPYTSRISKFISSFSGDPGTGEPGLFK